MDDDLGLLSSASSVTSVTCSSSTNNASSIFHNNITKSHQSCGGTKQRLHSGSFVRRSSSPSLISSSSRNDDNRTNRTSMNNDSVSSSNSSVFIEEKHTPSHHHEPGKLLKSLQSNHRSFFSEDYDTELSSICNMAKVKISKQHEIGFLNLLHECQAWIETTSNSKFPYPNDFRKSLENGVILCELLNVLKKDSVRRINRHSTPIAGIDNLNVFLKACQEHFHLIQSDLFDITDLEDLNRRRGDELASPFSCYSPDDSKESSDLSATSSEKLNNCNPNLNDYLADEEQKRRLKKVINTINWLSRKAIELGIQIPYHFDITNPANHSAKSVRSSIHPNHNTKAALGCSYNSVSSSTSSTSSSSSYCSSFSNSSLSQYSTSSSLSSSSSLSVIVPTSNLANSLLPPQIPHCSSKVSTPNNKSAYSSPASNFQKRHSIQQSNPFKNLDEIELAQRQASNIDDISNCHKPLLNHQSNNSNQNYTMSYIYKQQQSGKGSSLADKARSPSLVIDPSSSSASSTSSEYKNNKDNVEFIDQVSSSTHPSLINNDKDKIGDQDEIQLIDSTMSPISSTNSAVVSPRVNNNNNYTSNSLNTSTTVIPTRFIDRRVCSVPVEQKFNLNYSEVGQRLARKAEETLKTVEVSKEKQKQFVQSTFLNGNSNVTNAKNGPSLLQAALAYNKKNLADQQPQKPKSSGSGGGSASDDWQNSVDDWKKRRREKKNLPEPRTSQSFDFNDDEENNHNARNNERKRINRFENSPHYLSPPPTSKEHSDTTEQFSTSADDNKPVQTLEPLSVNTKTSSPENKKSPLPKTFETTANSSAGEKTNDDSNLNESAINDEDNDSMICTDFNYKFTEKLVEIERPFDHNSRGFGFLLNSGLQNKASASLKKLQDENIDNVLSQNFAQIVMVENGSLASQAGLIEGDLVTLINEVSTENLTNEQLRKVMRQRLQLNSIQMNLLTLKKLGKKIQSDSTKEKSVANTEPNAHEVDSSQSETNVDKTTKILSPLNTTTTSTPSNVQNKLFNLKSTATSSNPTHPHVDLVTPKPYKKSTSTATLQTNPAPANATTATLPNQKSHIF